MGKLTKLEYILAFTGLYLILFSILAVYRKNYEFLYYGVIVFALFLVLVRNYKKIYLTPLSLFGLSVAQFMHVLGGNIYFGETRLYDYWIVPELFRYDNFMHIVYSIILALAVYDIIRQYIDKKILYRKINLYLLLVLIILGIGALNEIMEFGAVIFFDAQDRVGDYQNNATDLVMNFIGATIGALLLMRRKEYRNERAFWLLSGD